MTYRVALSMLHHAAATMQIAYHHSQLFTQLVSSVMRDMRQASVYLTPLDLYILPSHCLCNTWSSQRGGTAYNALPALCAHVCSGQSRLSMVYMSLHERKLRTAVCIFLLFVLLRKCQDRDINLL